jgi:2-oxoglutarate dehydrogenase E2 component (dihydrolipoamide succinyltransferase)
VLDIATDKVDSEVPSTAEGIIEQILFKENDVVPIGTVIARIKVGAGASQAQSPTPTPVKEYEDAKVVEEIPYQPAPTNNNTGSQNAPRFYSPLVLNIAASEGISMSELETIPGTGQDGRVSKKDILAFVAGKAVSHKPSAISQSNEAAPTQNSNNQAMLRSLKWTACAN